MITAGDFKNGLTFEMEGKVYQVIEFQHVKPGKGAAFVRTKYRDVVTGATREASFNPTAKFENAVIERRDLEYLYCDGELYYFMDPESYEQIPLNADKLGDNFKFVKENTICRICSWKGMTLKSLLQHHSSKASILRCSVFLMVHLSHPYT